VAIGWSAWLLRPAIGKAAVQPVQAAVTPEPVAEPARDTSPGGRIVWIGRAARGTLLRVDGGRASTGKVYGALPGGTVELKIFPAERAARRLTVFTADERFATPVNEVTAAGPALFSWDPRHVMDLTVQEAPGAANGWRGFVLRVNSAQVTAFVVEWRRIAQ
jgi:hypothetical protein